MRVRGEQEGRRAGMIDDHRKSWQICSQYCLSRAACMTKEVSAAAWRLIPQDPVFELEEGAWVKDLSWLIGKITLDEWERLTVMHWRENLVCLTRLIPTPEVTSFSFSLIRKATGRRKLQEKGNMLFQILYVFVKVFQPHSFHCCSHTLPRVPFFLVFLFFSF